MIFRAIERVLIAHIRVYQRVVSPRLGRYLRCRFHPTCSEYAVLAIEKYGLAVGAGKIVARLKRCRPSNLDTCIDPP